LALLPALLAWLHSGCAREAPRVSPGDAAPATPSARSDAARPDHRPLPWLKPDAAPPPPDESGIADLKAISPREAVRRYLTLSTTGDLTKLRPFVAKQCYATPVGVATATAAFGTRLQVSEIKVELLSQKGDEAKVKYAVTGSITKRDPKLPPLEETSILGKPLKLRPPGATLTGIERSGELTLKREAGHWLVVCPKLPKVKAGVIGHDPTEPVHIPHFGPHGPGDGHDAHRDEHDRRGPSVRQPAPGAPVPAQLPKR
jgi:hypothetical protein